MSSANGAFGRHDRHDSAGVRAVTAPPRCHRVPAGRRRQCAASRTARTQNQWPAVRACANRRREQHRHPFGLAIVPYRNQLVGILKDLLFGRAACSCFFLAACRRRSSILRLLKPMAGSSPTGTEKSMCRCPESDQILRCPEMTQWAIKRHPGLITRLARQRIRSSTAGTP